MGDLETLLDSLYYSYGETWSFPVIRPLYCSDFCFFFSNLSVPSFTNPTPYGNPLILVYTTIITNHHLHAAHKFL